MTNRKTTRRALFMSIISLMLCCAMLVGTTFAWFTDSVTSANNIIKSGNLDIELEYWNGTTWVDVEGKSDILTNTLWEPGVTEIAYLRVANAGSLALKYQLGINIVSETAGVNQAGDEFKLSDYIKFGVVESETFATYATREAAVADLTDAKALNAGYTKAASMAADKELYLALVVYMPTTVDNVANHDGSNVPQINLGINVVATQLENESDSFGDDYDEDAWANALKVTNAAELATAIEAVEDGGLIALADNVTIDKDTAVNSSGNYYEGIYYIGDKSFTIDLNGKTLTNDSAVNDYLMLFKNDGNKANTITIKNGTLEAASSAYCAICTSTTSTQKITINLENVNLVGNNSGGAVAKIRGGAELNVKAGTTITGKNSYVGIEAAGTGTVVNIYEGAKIYQQGTSSYVGSLVGVSGTATANVYGGSGTSAQGCFIAMTSGGTINVSGGEWIANTDGTPKNNNFGVLIAQSENGAKSVINVTGGTFKGGYNCYGNAVGDAQLNISGGNFNADPSAYVADGYKAVETTNGYMVISGDVNYVADGVLKSADENTYFLSNKAGYDWMEKQDDGFFAGKTVELNASIDFGGATIGAIRFWNPENKTTFDGNGNTISNFVVENNEGNAGLFNGTMTVKNLVVDNANVTGQYAGVIAGNMYGDIENVTVKNSVVNGTYWQTGALVGQYNAGSITNCVVEDCTINGLAAVGALVGIVNETAGERNFVNCTVKNCEINQTGSFGSNYDEMFGVAVGLVNIENSTVSFNDCTFEGNTVKGVASDVLCGVVESGTSVTDIAATEEGFVLAKDCVNGGLYLYDTAEYTGTELEVPSGVTAIGNYAFAYNNTIKTVVLPATVTDLGRGFDSSAVKKVVLNEGLKTISPRAFKSTDALEEVKISSTVKTIADNAFQKSAIKEIVIPATVETIGEAAFGSSKIEKVTFEGNTSIQGYAFRGCSNLREVHLKGNDVTFIASTLNGRNSCWFCNGESNNPNTSNITFYVVNETVAARVKIAMGAEAANTTVYVNGVLYEG